MRIDYIPYRPSGTETTPQATPQRPDVVVAQAVSPVDGMRRVMRDLPQASVDPAQPLPGQKAQRAYQTTEAMGAAVTQVEGFDLWA